MDRLSVIKTAVLILTLTVLTLGCESPNLPIDGYHEFNHSTEDISDAPKNDVSIQVPRTYKQEFQQLEKTVSELPESEGLKSKLKKIKITYLNKDKKFLLKTTHFDNVKFLRFEFILKDVEQPIGFEVELNKQSIAQLVEYSPTQKLELNNEYKLVAECISKENPKCKVVKIMMTEYTSAKQPLARLGLIYSLKDVNLNVQRAMSHPEDANPVVSELTQTTVSKKAVKERISFANGTTVSAIHTRLSGDRELNITNVISKVDKLHDEEQLVDNVTITDNSGDEKPLQQTTSTLTGVDYVNEDGDEPSLNQINRIDFETESIQIITTDVSETEEDTQPAVKPVEPQNLPLKVAPKPSSKPVPQPQQSLKPQQKQQQPLANQPQVANNQTYKPNSGTPPYREPHKAPDTIARFLSPDIFKIDFDVDLGENALKQTTALMSLKSDPWVQNYLRMVQVGTKGAQYCDVKNNAELLQSCSSPEGCSEHVRMFDSSRSVQRHLNTMATLADYIKPAYQSFDVSPVISNVMYVESRYSYSEDNNFPIQLVLNSRESENVLGPFQFKPRTAKNLISEIYQMNNVDKQPMIFPLVSNDPAGPYSKSNYTYDLRDDRAYLVPSAYMGAFFHNKIFKMTGNRPDLLYLGYHLGEPIAAQNIACSGIELTGDEATDKQLVNQCKRDFNSGGSKNGLLSALRCNSLSDAQERRKCFGKLKPRYRDFDQSRMFGNSLARIRKYNMVDCNRLHETYKYLAVSLVTLEPDLYGFDKITKHIVDDERMKIYNPYNPLPYGGYASVQ